MIGVLVASSIVTGLHADSTQTLVVASLVLGLLNAFIRPVLWVLSLPLMWVTLGLFSFVINAGLLLFTSWLVKGFHVDSFWAAFKAAILISVVQLIINIMRGKPPVNVKRGNGGGSEPPPPPSPPAGSGPVIDV